VPHVEGVGATAKMTAAARARETERTDHLFDDPWAAALAGEDGFAFLTAQDAARGLAEPNPAFVVRHRFFDDFVWERAVSGTHHWCSWPPDSTRAPFAFRGPVA
jgi:O-methyltransferase involved in polyketide biosynthesis